MATFLPDVIRGGVDVVQLREKVVAHADQVEAAREMLRICRDHDVPFIVNDSAWLAAEVGADGVHVGQEDTSVQRCRELLGSEAVVGLSTHDRDEFTTALATTATYFGAGPVSATPTKPGREGTGIAYPLSCEEASDRPVFVTGGVDATNVGGFVAAGLRRFVVVRAITNSSDPARSARTIRDALDEALSAVTIEPAQ